MVSERARSAAVRANSNFKVRREGAGARSRCGRMPALNDDAAQGKKAFHGAAMRRGAEDRSCRQKGGLSFASRTGATQAVGGSTVRVLDERRIRQFSQSFIRSAFPK
jgi:hypothetical protein